MARAIVVERPVTSDAALKPFVIQEKLEQRKMRYFVSWRPNRRSNPKKKPFKNLEDSE